MPKRGWRSSEETKEKLRAAWERGREARVAQMRERWADPSYRARHKDVMSSDDVRAKLSASAKARCEKPEERDRLAAIATEFMTKPESRALYSERSKGMWADPVKRDEFVTARKQEWSGNAERRQRLSEQMKEQWRDISLSDKRLKGWLERVTRPSKLERMVHVILDALSIAYVSQKQIGKVFVDIFVPSANLIIECDGEYWHSRPGRKESDARREALLVARGYTVLRLPEADIVAGRIVDMLKAVANGQA
jgi:very-short-patch-repair endonuclease